MQPELELCHALISFDCSGAGGQLDRQMLQQFLQQQALETLPGPELWGSPVTQNHGVNCVNTFFFCFMMFELFLSLGIMPSVVTSDLVCLGVLV